MSEYSANEKKNKIMEQKLCDFIFNATNYLIALHVY